MPKRIFVKPPILTKYFADFAVLNARDELLLVEIGRPSLKLVKKDGISRLISAMRSTKCELGRKCLTSIGPPRSMPSI